MIAQYSRGWTKLANADAGSSCRKCKNSNRPGRLVGSVYAAVTTIALQGFWLILL